TADACAGLAAHIAQGLRVREVTVQRRVRQELPFMATETWLMTASLRGGDRQDLHEKLRVHSLAAQEAVERGDDNPLLSSVAADASFRTSREVRESAMARQHFTGGAAAQTREFLAEVVRPRLEKVAMVEV